MYQKGYLFRQAYSSGETYFGVLTLVYDALAEDLRRAGQASRVGDIQLRCDASNHALMLLGHLQAWARDLDDGELTASLERFYSFVRAAILRLQSDGRLKDFEELGLRILEVRSTWQAKGRQVFQSDVAEHTALHTHEQRPIQGPSRPAWSA